MPEIIGQYMTVTLAMSTGPETVPAVYLTEHFAVHGRRTHWTVTHRLSGHAVAPPVGSWEPAAGFHIPRKSLAVMWARMLERLPIPWAEVTATTKIEEYEGAKDALHQAYATYEKEHRAR
jgi:hypothetical protein